MEKIKEIIEQLSALGEELNEQTLLKDSVKAKYQEFVEAIAGSNDDEWRESPLKQLLDAIDDINDLADDYLKD